MPVITLPDGSQKPFDQPVTVDEVAASIGAGLRKAALAGRVDGRLVDTSHLLTQDAKLKSEISELKGQMTVLLKDKILFASGSARVGGPGQEALRKVAEALRNVQGRIIRVEGHTDDLPTDPKGPFPTNWELSVARAVNVVRFLGEKGGVPSGRLVAAGHSDTRPVASNATPKGRARNRRIEILLIPDLPAASAGEPKTAAQTP